MKKPIFCLLLLAGTADGVTYTAGQNGVLASTENGYAYTASPLPLTPVTEVMLYASQSKSGNLEVNCWTYANLGGQGSDALVRIREYSKSGVSVALAAADLDSADLAKRSAASMLTCLEVGPIKASEDLVVRIPKGAAVALPGTLRGYALKVELDPFQRATPILELLK